VDPGRVLESVRLESMALEARDPRTGAVLPAHKKGTIEAFTVPYVLVMILIMIVLVGSSQMVASVAEDKLQRVYEMLLCSATPFELMMGKVLACVGRSLVSSAFYILGGMFVLQGLALFGLVPFAALPWFFVYLVAEVILLASLGTALGSACATPQEAQPLVMVVMLPVLIPLFLMPSILQQPNSVSSTAISLFPVFTPVVMLLRQTLPGGVPEWQPWAGLAGVLLFSLAGAWAAARIFRIGVLFQGTTPKLAEILRWAARG
jgi:ABC-2 type transport system permease protein